MPYNKIIDRYIVVKLQNLQLKNRIDIFMIRKNNQI